MCSNDGPKDLGTYYVLDRCTTMKGQELKPTEAEKVIRSLIEVAKMLEEISAKYQQRLAQYSNPLPPDEVCYEDKPERVIPDYFFELSGQFERIRYYINYLNEIYNALEL